MKDLNEDRKLSYLHVADEVLLMGKTIGELLNEAAAKFGNREAIYEEWTRKSISFNQLKKESEELAVGLLDLGLKRGDRVGIWGSNSHRWLVTFFACAKAGLISVCINSSFHSQELLHSLTAVNVNCLVMDQSFKSQMMLNILMDIVPGVGSFDLGQSPSDQFKSSQVPSLRFIISMRDETRAKGVYSFSQIVDVGKTLGLKSIEQISSEIQFDDVFNIQFTSGSTGKPKGVMLSHHNVASNSFFCGRRMGLTFQDKICLTVQLFHAFGLSCCALCALHFGSSLIIPSSIYSPAASVRVAKEQKCTIMYGTPTMHLDMLTFIESPDHMILTRAVTGAAPCSEQLIKDMKSGYGVESVISLHGMTEASCLNLSLPSDSDHLRSVTVGYPMEHMEVKMVDSEGQIVPLGTPGELCVRGSNVMIGYWGLSKQTVETIDWSRWFHTGDLSVMRESGHVEIVGRIKDVINRGGENIYPREIEIFLETHPHILETQVFGVPDFRLGEQVAVWIKLKPSFVSTPEIVQEFCKEKISWTKIPHFIKFVEDFPKTTSGKISKFHIRTLYILELGL